MIPAKTVLRIARPTDRLQEIARMYADGLGFEWLSEFSGHNGFDGVIIGHPHHPWHLEFTQHRSTQAGRAPTQDNLLVFYVPDTAAWEACCASMRAAGFAEVPAFNGYWDQRGRTFEDLDGYRVVMENDSWRK
ncbi:MAG: VOC family protein [Gammaproteobacteria bacterium]